MIKNGIVAFVLFVAFFLLFWNALDYLYSAVLTKGAYSLATGLDLILPLVVAAVIGALLFLRKKEK